MNANNKTMPRCCYPREVISTPFPVETKTAICRLYQTHPYPLCFLVEIEFEDECASAFLGAGFARAARIFEMLVEGAVTPCTLLDVLEGL